MTAANMTSSYIQADSIKVASNSCYGQPLESLPMLHDMTRTLTKSSDKGQASYILSTHVELKLNLIVYFFFLKE